MTLSQLVDDDVIEKAENHERHEEVNELKRHDIHHFILSFVYYQIIFTTIAFTDVVYLNHHIKHIVVLPLRECCSRQHKRVEEVVAIAFVHL